MRMFITRPKHKKRLQFGGGTFSPTEKEASKPKAEAVKEKRKGEKP